MRLVCGPGCDGKDRVSDVDLLTASMALRRAPMLSRLTSAAGSASAAFPAAAYGLLTADEKSLYSLYSSLLRLQPAVIGLNPAAMAAAAAMVRPTTMTVFPSPPSVAGQPPTTPAYSSTSKTADTTSGSNCEAKPASGGGGIVPSSMLNGGHRYRPYMPPASLATVATRLDTSTVRQSN